MDHLNTTKRPITMNAKRYSLFIIATLAAVCSSLGQWTTQTIDLNPGWNAVYLHVQPEPARCDTIFSNVSFSVESVRTYNHLFSSVQYVQDPSAVLLDGPAWLTWVPPTAGFSALKNLYRMDGGKPYFIKLPDTAQPVTWAVMGKPVTRPIDWREDSFNLVGFSIQPTNLPTFGAFFAESPELAGQPLYRMNTLGAWEPVANTATALMRNGEAFWIRLASYSRFQGAIAAEVAGRTGLDFGRIMMERTLTVRNDTDTPKTVRVRQLPSEPVPAGSNQPLLAGEVPLSCWKMNLANGLIEWQDFVDEQKSIPANAECDFRFAVRRQDMAPFTPPAGAEAAYQSLIEVTEVGGPSRYVVPVVAQSLEDGAAHPRAGLWVGHAVIRRVNQPAHPSTPVQPVATASEFQFRLIVHVDETGQPNLLQKVLQMWKDGSYQPDPANPAVQIVDQPGRHVLVTDEGLIPQFSGVALRDGQPVGRRISSSAFGFSDPIPLTGPGVFGANTITCDVTLPYDHPLNPFTHRYHPDHDNLNQRFEAFANPDGVESFTVTRTLELAFESQDPEGLLLAGWGDNQLGGTYRETLSGIHRDDLHVDGFFRLHHVSRVGVLNDGI
jgi:hypothetical protein